MRQTNARVRRDTPAENQIVSLFEPSTEVIRKGKPQAHRIGKIVKLRRRRQIVVAYELRSAPSDSDLLLGAIETHQATLGLHARTCGRRMPASTRPRTRRPRSQGVKRVCIPTAPPRA